MNEIKLDMLEKDRYDLMIDKIGEKFWLKKKMEDIEMMLINDFNYDKEDDIDFIYHLLLRIIKDWVDMEEDYYHIIACWILGTYFIEHFISFPYIFINAVKRSGKTRLLKLCATLSKDGVYTANLTEAVLFRLPAAKQCSLFIDEAERITGREKGALRLLLNSAYKKGMKIFRARKNPQNERYVIDEFEIFIPIALANIQGIDDVLEDRCITIILERSMKINVVGRPEFFEYDFKIKFFKYIISSVVSDVGVGWGNLYNMNDIMFNDVLHTNTSYTDYTTNTNNTTYTIIKALQNNIIGRDLELWYPLLLIKKTFRDKTFDDFIEIAKRMIKEKQTIDILEDRDTSILMFISNFIIGKSKDDFFPYTDIVKQFIESEGSDWLNSWKLGKILRRLKIVIEKRRMGKGVEIRLSFEKIKKKIQDLGLDLPESKVEKQEAL